MSKTSKQNRRDNEIDSRIYANEGRINSLGNEVKKLEKEHDRHIERHIVDDLQAVRFSGSDKPLYTYQEIADRYNVPVSTVSRVAEENGLLRRANKTS